MAVVFRILVPKGFGGRNGKDALAEILEEKKGNSITNKVSSPVPQPPQATRDPDQLPEDNLGSAIMYGVPLLLMGLIVLGLSWQYGSEKIKEHSQAQITNSVSYASPTNNTAGVYRAK